MPFLRVLLILNFLIKDQLLVEGAMFCFCVLVQSVMRSRIASCRKIFSCKSW